MSWPFSDITPGTVGTWAAQGRWDLVNRAARMASRRTAVSQPDTFDLGLKKKYDELWAIYEDLDEDTKSEMENAPMWENYLEMSSVPEDERTEDASIEITKFIELYGRP